MTGGTNNGSPIPSYDRTRMTYRPGNGADEEGEITKMIEEKYYSLTQLKSIMRTEGNQWTGPYERIHPDDLKKLRPADVHPIVKGEWVKNKDRVGWHCSVCKVDNNYAYNWNSEKGKDEFQDNYCPCCGAKMGGADG